MQSPPVKLHGIVKAAQGLLSAQHSLVFMFKLKFQSTFSQKHGSAKVDKNVLI